MKISKKYQPLWTSKANYFIITGGRGSAKSFTVADFIENLTFEEGHTILFTRYTLTSAHISVIPEFSEKIEMEGHEPFFKVNKTDIQNTETKSQIVFRGIRTSSGNQTANLKSIQNVTTWILDEAEELTDETVFDKIDESIRKAGTQNRVIIILNPCTKEHFIYKRFFEEMGVEAGFNGEKENVCYIHTTWEDNKENLSQKFILKALKLKQTNPTKYAHVMDGAWLDAAEGVIFDNWSFGKFDDSLPYGFGMDFGFFPDPDILVKVAVDTKRNKIYAKELFQLNNAGLDELDRKIKETKIRKVGDKTVPDNAIIYADSSEKRLISDLQRKGNNVTQVIKGAGSVLAGIKLMQDYEIIVDPDSTNIAKELNHYVWSDKKSGIPVDAYNHWIDGIRYFCSMTISSYGKMDIR
jgi:phage terminase large subunit